MSPYFTLSILLTAYHLNSSQQRQCILSSLISYR